MSDPIEKPQDWDKVLSVALLRLDKKSQRQAAIAAGVGLRTVQAWEACSWWTNAKLEALVRFVPGLAPEAMSTFVEAMRKGTPELVRRAELAKWLLERTVPMLTPPRQRLDHRAVPYDPRDLTDEELERSVAGEEPDQVLAETRGRRREEEPEADGA